MSRVKSKEVKIYAPVGFKATWQKYHEICAQNGTNASKEIRKFVESQVAMRPPEKPQHLREKREDKPQTRLENYEIGKEASQRAR